MKTTAILSGLLALFLGACSSEPASTSTSPRAAAATDSQAALILDRVP